ERLLESCESLTLGVHAFAWASIDSLTPARSSCGLTSMSPDFHRLHSPRERLQDDRKFKSRSGVRCISPAMDRKEAVGLVRPLRWRYLIDIIVLVAVTFLLDAVLGAFITAPINWEMGFVLDAVQKMLLVAIGCGLVLLRGERLGDIGLKRPASWART